MTGWIRGNELENAAGGGKLANRVSKTAGWVEHEGGDRVLVLHKTPIITRRADDEAIVLNSGGWRTPTTKKYMNDGLSELRSPWWIYQDRNVWYLTNGGFGEGKAIFRDGVTIFPDGKIAGASPMTSSKRVHRLAKRINEYCGKYMDALFDGRVPAPGPGDCWFCYLTSEDGSWGGNDHIVSHIDTNYFVPSLLVRAINVYPISPVATWVLQSLWYGGVDEKVVRYTSEIAREQLRSSLRAYVRKEMNLPPR